MDCKGFGTEILSWNYPGRTEENHEIPQSG
jgi:hypothetical protein